MATPVRGQISRQLAGAAPYLQDPTQAGDTDPTVEVFSRLDPVPRRCPGIQRRDAVKYRPAPARRERTAQLGVAARAGKGPALDT